MTTGKHTTSKQKEVKARYRNLGELDTRIGTAVLAITNPPSPWTILLAHLDPPAPAGNQQTASTIRKPCHLHLMEYNSSQVCDLTLSVSESLLDRDT